MSPYAIGASFPSESRSFQDEQTGAKVVQLTNHASINHNLYFLTSSFTPDERIAIVASNRSGNVNYYGVAISDGRILQLTDE